MLFPLTGNAVGSFSTIRTTHEVVPPAETDTSIRLEGHLVPHRFASLSLGNSGPVAEVLVQEGELVEAGAVLIRLGDVEQLLADIAAAELELLTARISLDDLHSNSGLELAQAEKALAEAHKVLAFAKDKVISLKKPTPQATIDQVHANLLLAENRLKDINKEIQKVEKKFANKKSPWWWFLDQRDFKQLLNNLDKSRAYAERRHIDAQQKYNDIREPVDPVDLAMAESELAIAQARVIELEREIQALQNGPDPDDINLADARIKAAEATLVAAETAYKERELIAPFTGKVVDLKKKAGEWAEANQALIQLADTSQWIVESDDLTEIDVPNVSLGSVATIIPEAMPESELEGVLEAIDDLYQEKRGDITYTARIRLNENDPRLRWGMTVAIILEE
jgi:multidrug resistance efflux pump